MQKHNISGLPVVQGEHLVGILTGRDVRFADSSLLTSDVMTKKVITAPAETNIEGAREILHKHRVEKLPLIDKEGRLKGLMTIKDILQRGRFPNAARHENGGNQGRVPDWVRNRPGRGCSPHIRVKATNNRRRRNQRSR